MTDIDEWREREREREQQDGAAAAADNDDLYCVTECSLDITRLTD